MAVGRARNPRGFFASVAMQPQAFESPMAKVNGEPWVFYLGGANAVHCKYQSHHIRHPTGCGWVRLAIDDTSIHPAASGVGEIRREVVREVKGLGCRRDFKR